MIDRLRKELQERLDQLLAETDKLRGALSALDPRPGRPAAKSTPAKSTPAKSTPAKSTATTRTRSAARPAAAKRRSGRTAPGNTRQQILAALAGGTPKTAGEVAAATGLGRGSVSTTLSKLSKTGEVVKAERGYRLPEKTG